MTVFHADYGVEFRDSDDQVWAHFTLDEVSTTLINGVTQKVYAFETDDPEVIERLERAEGYGIREAAPASAAPSAADSTPTGEGDSAPALEPPSGNADRDEWAAFLLAQGIAFSEDEGRNDLRDRWKAHTSA